MKDSNKKFKVIKPLCFLLGFFAICFISANFPHKEDIFNSLNRAVVLIEKNEDDWTLTRMDLYHQDSGFSYVGNLNPEDGSREVKSGSIDDINTVIKEDGEKIRVRTIFTIMRKLSINRIRKENHGYVFFEKRGGFFNRGDVYVYTVDEKKWIPTSGASNWLKKSYKFERIDGHWYKAKQ